MIKKHTGDIVSYLNPETRAAVKSLTEKQYDVTMIDAHKIYVNEKNFYGLRGVEEMANSMAVSDNIPPLVVAPAKNGRYKLISGERRLSAVLLRESRGEIEHPKVPCFVREIQPIGPLSIEQSETFLMIIENAHRDKTPLEKLHEIQAMEPIARTIYDDAYSKGDVKGRFRTFFAENILNMTESALTRLKSLEHLIPAAEEALEDGRIGLSLAVELSKSSEKAQTRYMELLDQGEIQGTLRELQELQLKENPPKEKAAPIKVKESKQEHLAPPHSAAKKNTEIMEQHNKDDNGDAEPLLEQPEVPEPPEPPQDAPTVRRWSEALEGIPKKLKTTIKVDYIEVMGKFGAGIEFDCHLSNRRKFHADARLEEEDAVYDTKEQARDAALSAYLDDDFREAVTAAGYLPKREQEVKPLPEEDEQKSKSDTGDAEWAMVNSAIADEFRERIATAQNNARWMDSAIAEERRNHIKTKPEKAALVLYHNRIAAVYEELLDEFLELAVVTAQSLESAAREGEA